ncbi:MAG: UbiA family prenyltransferase [Euryarchaeota archaeon]|jgi:geranylgeranylglycerol-phosphate geranylgeranyltransferase|nr:UbiA family prenyltransferase [Euryarchaeota archaeon]MBT4981690.1 UbiA family prenyltransferase [Euryarchaeota archaeon]MBT5183992.1 UbiA family prenyltransferase [Euryarchaeota archaeon]
MWREVVELSRPKNVILATITVPLGAHLALGGVWSSQALGLVALQTASAICFVAAGNTFNDVSDVNIDAMAKPHRPIPSGRISASDANKVGYAFTFLSALFMAAGVAFTQDIYPLIGIWTFAALLMYTYDAGPQTKRMGLIGNVAISLMVGAVIIFGAAAVSLFDTPIVFFAAGVAFFANLSREIIKDCEDMESDEGRKTLPMRIGLLNARAVAYVCILASMIVLGLAHLYGPFEYHQIVFHAPAIFILFSLNGPLFRGEDHKSQQSVRVAMLLGLLAFAVQVSIL